MPRFRLKSFSLALTGSCFLLSTCVTPPQAPEAPALDPAAVTQLIPTGVRDRSGWAADVIAGIRATDKSPTAERVCAVLATIEQESNYQADPLVRELPRIVRQGLKEKLKRLGPLAEPAVDLLLKGKVPGRSETFAQRVAQLRTERDLDRLFRQLATAYRDRLPRPLAMAVSLSALLGRDYMEQLNPVTTAGSMQVKVDFARKLSVSEGSSEEDLRDRLYTREGGVHYGTARLLGYPASYDAIIYRFADYNAGVYASRNAAWQAMLAALTHFDLALDGDLLAYDERGQPRDGESKTEQALLRFGEEHQLSAWTLQRDLRREKEQDFEETKSWKEVRQAWEAMTGKTAPYAQLPDVQLISPKLQRPRSTRWFAEAVLQRYKSCRSRLDQAHG